MKYYVDEGGVYKDGYSANAVQSKGFATRLFGGSASAILKAQVGGI